MKNAHWWVTHITKIWCQNVKKKFKVSQSQFLVLEVFAKTHFLFICVLVNTTSILLLFEHTLLLLYFFLSFIFFIFSFFFSLPFFFSCLLLFNPLYLLVVPFIQHYCLCFSHDRFSKKKKTLIEWLFHWMVISSFFVHILLPLFLYFIKYPLLFY